MRNIELQNQGLAIMSKTLGEILVEANNYFLTARKRESATLDLSVEILCELDREHSKSYDKMVRLVDMIRRDKEGEQ